MFDDGIVLLDNGLYKVWFVCNYWVVRFNILLLDNVLVIMGVGLLVVINVKLDFFERKVLVVCGDGGFMMNF